MVKIFISYRRKDSEEEAGRIYKELVRVFGKGNVIKDTHSFKVGNDFVSEMIYHVTTSNIMLALIGENWLKFTKEEEDQARVHDPDDYVYKEMEWGLVHPNVTVIPIVLDEAKFPRENDLPPSVRELARQNAARIRRDPDFENDINSLVKIIRKSILPNPWLYRIVSFVAGSIITLCLAMIVLLYFIPPPILNSIRAAIQNARSFGGTNEAWQPFVLTFEDGIEMVLVPSGCFMKSSINGVPSEQALQKICFDTPFWIDRTEVSQDDFARVGGTKGRENSFAGSDRPVEQITWFEARDFCELRGARLPTESEWEYAAYGVENLVYPWGNDWSENNLIWNRNPTQGTANVGSLAEGASWVGALDMNGNVWEWMNSVYQDSQNTRALRGGSWFDDDVLLFQDAVRFTDNPDGWDYLIGFRCVRFTN